MRASRNTPASERVSGRIEFSCFNSLPLRKTIGNTFFSYSLKRIKREVVECVRSGPVAPVFCKREGLN